MKEFKGKVAVITGGTSGIGRAIAERCADEGMKVVIAGMDVSALEKTENDLKVKGASVLALKIDVSKLSQVEELAQRTISTYNEVHFLFNNAGVEAGTTIWESSISDWQWVLDVNLWGVIFGIKVFVPLMLGQKNECHIVNTASTAGFNAGPGLGIYKVTKHAIVTLSETLYYELAARESKIRVSVLCPGWVKTSILQSERNRPSELRSPQRPVKSNLQDIEIEKMIYEGVTTGMEPTVVADKAFNANRLDKFYIFTHPEAKPLIQARMEDILNESNPRIDLA